MSTSYKPTTNFYSELKSAEVYTAEERAPVCRDLIIRSMELFKAPPRWLFLKITTEGGVVGWGEPIVEGRVDTVAACVKELEYYLIGKSAGNIEEIWNLLYRCGFYRGGPVLMSAMAGIDQALWDIKGKYYGLPVYEFFGGAVRDKVKVYAPVRGVTREEKLASVAKRIEQGYDTVKMGGFDKVDWVDSFRKVEKVVGDVAAIREKYGSSIDIAMDLHGRVHKGMARVLMHELEPYHLLFIEEPVQHENINAFRELKDYTSVPIATGERNMTRWECKELITGGGIDIIQPDLSHAGGITECRKIATFAETYDVSCAPHCPLGPLAFASCMQIDLCTPNSTIQEQSFGVHNGEDSFGFEYLADVGDIAYENGYVKKFKKPGLGVEINEEVVREADKYSHNWKNPVLRQEDGSIAEW